MAAVTNAGNKYFIFLLIIGICFLVYLLSPILTPFLIAALLAYLCNPLLHRLLKFGISRGLASIIILMCIIFFIVALILLLIPMVEKQIGALLSVIPSAAAWVQTNMYPLLESHLGIQLNGNFKDLINIPSDKLMQAGGDVFHTMVQSGKALFETLLNLVFIPVITFYLLRDWDMLIKKIHDLIPKPYQANVSQIAHECDVTLSAFVRGQLLVMLALCFFYAITLSLLGLKAGLVIGIIIGVISLVPYLGAIVGIVIAVISALVQFGTFSSVMWVVFIFAIGHILENVYLTPKLIGSRIGLHPVAVIFAIFAGGVLFGFTGVLLALPVASICVVLLRHLSNYYKKSTLYRVKS